MLMTREKTGGRKKGTPNKNGMIVGESLVDADINLVEEVLRVLPELDPSKKVDVLLKLMEFVYPKRKSIDLAVDPIEKERKTRVIINIPSNGREKM